MPASLRIGDVIGGFTLVEPLHQGGMARLWAVTHPHHAKAMVMKMPLLREGDDPTTLVSFEVEQMILPRLSGPHVPAFVAAGIEEAQPWLVMERLAGASLSPAFETLPMAPEAIAAAGVKVATALNGLHRQQVVHLDIKPANIMLRETGEAVLIDFGLSHHAHLPDLLQEEFRLPIGTAPFMAPEQTLKIRSDPRSDIFALGVMLYYFATGEYPFGESSTGHGLRHRIWRDPQPPRRLNQGIPPWLQEIILRAMEVQPKDRYATAAQMAFDLQHPEQVVLTARAERRRRDGLVAVMRRRLAGIAIEPPAQGSDRPGEAPIAMAAVDVSDGLEPLAEALRITIRRVLQIAPGARLACVSVLKTSLIQVDQTLDEHGRSRHLMRLLALRHWAQSMQLPPEQITFHVLEAVDPAAAILEFAAANHVDHIIMGARSSSTVRRYLGSVSTEVVAKAPCSVTVVRAPHAGTRWLSGEIAAQAPAGEASATRDYSENNSQPEGQSLCCGKKRAL